MYRIEGYLCFRTEKGRDNKIIARTSSGNIVLGAFDADNCISVGKVVDRGNYFELMEEPLILLRPEDDPEFSGKNKWCITSNFPKEKVSYGHCMILRAVQSIVPIKTGLKKVRKR